MADVGARSEDQAVPLLAPDARGAQGVAIEQELFDSEPLNWLPSWAYTHDTDQAYDVRRFAQKLQRRHIECATPSGERFARMYFGCFVGPAVPWASLEVVLLWSVFVVLPPFAVQHIDCPEDDLSFPIYPKWLLVASAPILCVCLVLEYWCQRYHLVPMVCALKRLDFFGINMNGKFKPWFILSLGLSFVNHLDIVTNGLLLAAAFKSQTCPSHPAIHAIWSETMSQSLLAFVPGIANLDFAYLFAVSWAFMFLQLAWAILFAAPLKPCGIDYKIGDGVEWGGSLRQQFATMMQQKCNFGIALFELAEAGRMSSITSMRNARTLDVMQWHLDHGTLDLAHFTKTSLWSMIAKIAIKGFLENALVMNFQVSLAAILRHLNGNTGVNWEILFSVSLTSLLSALQILESVKYCFNAHDLVCQFREKSPKKVEANMWLWRASISMLAFVIIAFSLLILYGVVKVAMMFICPGSIWNLTHCVEFGH